MDPTWLVIGIALGQQACCSYDSTGYDVFIGIVLGIVVAAGAAWICVRSYGRF